VQRCSSVAAARRTDGTKTAPIGSGDLILPARHVLAAALAAYAPRTRPDSDPVPSCTLQPRPDLPTTPGFRRYPPGPLQCHPHCLRSCPCSLRTPPRSPAPHTHHPLSLRALLPSPQKFPSSSHPRPHSCVGPPLPLARQKSKRVTHSLLPFLPLARQKSARQKSKRVTHSLLPLLPLARQKSARQKSKRVTHSLLPLARPKSMRVTHSPLPLARQKSPLDKRAPLPLARQKSTRPSSRPFPARQHSKRVIHSPAHHVATLRLTLTAPQHHHNNPSALPLLSPGFTNSSTPARPPRSTYFPFYHFSPSSFYRRRQPLP
jgi:hypothetical protein